MELKQAGVVCLIAFFAATLVVLIAGSLDNRAADRLEPQLAKIAEELQTIRKSLQGENVDEVLMVYYFHVTKRCPTCNAAEKMTRETLDDNFADELKSGKLVLKTVNMEEPAGGKLALSFEIGASPAIGLAVINGDKMSDKKVLKALGGLIDDEPAFAEYLSGPIDAMLKTMDKQTVAAETEADPELPPPDAEVTVPDAPDEIPLP